MGRDYFRIRSKYGVELNARGVSNWGQGLGGVVWCGQCGTEVNVTSGHLRDIVQLSHAVYKLGELIVLFMIINLS